MLLRTARRAGHGGQQHLCADVVRVQVDEGAGPQQRAVDRPVGLDEGRGAVVAQGHEFSDPHAGTADQRNHRQGVAGVSAAHVVSFCDWERPPSVDAAAGAWRGARVAREER